MLSVALAKVRQLKIADFWNKTPCSFLDIYGRFGGMSCLYLQGRRKRKTACLYKTLVYNNICGNGFLPSSTWKEDSGTTFLRDVVSTRLHGVISRKIIVIFIVTAENTSSLV
jgi:hypothetical protein